MPDNNVIIPGAPITRRNQPRLGDLLIEANAITPEQLAKALQVQRTLQRDKKLGEILISEGVLTAVRLAEALSTQLKLPMLSLTRYNPMPEAIKLVPKSVAERLHLLPLKLVGNDQLFVAMSDPLDLLAQDEVRILTSRNLKIGVTTQDEIDRNLERLYNLQSNIDEAIIEIGTDIQSALDSELEVGPDDAPVIQIVANLLRQAVREGASDVHIESYERESRVRFRVDGLLYNAFDYPVALHPSVVARIKIMSSMDIAEKRKPQDGRILINVDRRHVDLRVSALPTIYGEKVVMRILEQDNAMVGLEKLGLEHDDMEHIENFCKLPWGIVLLTGPTGCGKSTTLYSMLQQINSPDVNIVTVEDPVEYTMPGVNQVSLNERAGLTFDSALRSILRQDPDKVMIGEIRDQQTAQIAIRAALTGHLVLSTLHTNDAPSAATRMIDMGVEPFLVSASLCGVMAQRLVRNLCPYCRQEYELTHRTCDDLHVPYGTHAYRPVGCSECRNGYRGRRGIFEILELDDELRSLIAKGVTSIELRNQALKKGMKTLRQSGINAALAGFTSLEEVLTSTL